MNEWFPILSDALKNEFATHAMIATLATVDETGAPHARSVVCRRINAQSLVFVSDRRSDKNKHLRTEPRAEVVFWLPASRTQFRLAGEIDIGNDPAIWNSLSDSSRALFHWPAPGTPRVQNGQAFPAKIPAGSAPPESFEVLTLRPLRVERLDLNHHPHDRRVWTFTGPADQWVGIDINP